MALNLDKASSNKWIDSPNGSGSRLSPRKEHHQRKILENKINNPVSSHSDIDFINLENMSAPTLAGEIGEGVEALVKENILDSDIVNLISTLKDQRRLRSS